MNILFLADPSSIHDLKWITYQADEHQLFLVRRASHVSLQEDYKHQILEVGFLHDFSIIRIFKTISGFLKLRSIIKTHKIDVFHVYFVEPNILWAIFKPFLGVKIIATTRGTDILVTIKNHFRQFSLANLYTRILYQIAFRNCDCITGTSKGQKQMIRELFGLSDQVHVIRTGVDVSAMEKISSGSSLISGTRKYVFMPRVMKPLYNHEFTVEAIGLLKKEILADYDFVFIDEDAQDQSYVNRIKTLMEDNGAANFIFLTRQNQEQLFKLYYGTSLVIMNPISDGTPVSGLEAMYFGKPLILGPLGYDRDVFGEWTYILGEWSVQELAHTIEQAFLGFSEEESIQAREVVINLGNRSSEMKKISSLYEAVTASVEKSAST
ncbi:MAG: glycosyltransferase family 4 protein [Cytophagales bacterium]|nr:glycosyltransferase family 4 protein [Cytophagales bacterium]